jgi:hypothetical protein
MVLVESFCIIYSYAYTCTRIIIFANPLEAYTESVRFWIRDVYALSNLPAIIGGEITVLSIT